MPFFGHYLDISSCLSLATSKPIFHVFLQQIFGLVHNCLILLLFGSIAKQYCLLCTLYTVQQCTLYIVYTVCTCEAIAYYSLALSHHQAIAFCWPAIVCQGGTILEKTIGHSPFCAKLFQDPTSKNSLFKVAFSRSPRPEKILIVIRVAKTLLFSFFKACAKGESLLYFFKS